MDLVTPGIGLIFWTTLVFLIVLIILRAFAWKPLLNAVKAREDSIKGALNAAEKARDEMLKLQAGNEKILLEARTEKELIIKEAREMREMIINEARERTNEETLKMIEAARIKIENQKLAAIEQMKEQIVILSLDIAEKILREKLSADKEQTLLINRLIDGVKLN
jgi:F-type H+-transporting ATPase subunit b